MSRLSWLHKKEESGIVPILSFMDYKKKEKVVEVRVEFAEVCSGPAKILFTLVSPYFIIIFYPLFLQVRTNVRCVNALTQQESVTPEQGIQPRRSKRLKKPPLWQKDYIMY